jgi:DNA-binding CsgD family transcriptional regulator
MQNPFSIPPQAMSALLAWINNKNEGVFWIKSLEGKQLYVGEEFETIWQRPCQLLYDVPTMWPDTLLEDDREDISEKMKIRKSPTSELINETLFRIHVPGDQIKYIRDCCIKLYDQEGKLRAFAGIGQALPVPEWEQLYKIYSNQKADIAYGNNQAKLTDIINTVLQKELGLNSKPPGIEQAKDFHVLTHNKQYPLSRREFQCLFHLASGKSAKETGALLFLSQRTVETYLDAIKRKLNCRTKLEILSKIDINHLLASHFAETRMDLQE